MQNDLSSKQPCECLEDDCDECRKREYDRIDAEDEMEFYRATEPKEKISDDYDDRDEDDLHGSRPIE